MKHFFGCAAAAALIASAACNRAPGANETAESEEQNPAAQNVAAGSASPVDIAAVMHARHEHYETIGKGMKAIGDQMKADSPSIEVIRRHAAQIAGYGPQILTWFPEGSGPETGRDTRAKAEIWSDPETFRAAAQRFEQTSGAFNRAAQSGDMAAVQAALPALRQSCSNCHDKFRGPEHH